MRFIIMALACFRLVHFVMYERGPKNFMQKIREDAGIIHYDDGQVASTPTNGGIGDALSCHYCASFWVGIGVVVLEWTSPRVNDVLAVSAGAILVKEQLTHG